MQNVESFTINQLEQINRIIYDLYEVDQPFHVRITNFFHSIMDLVYFDKASLLFFYQDGAGNYHKRNSITWNWDTALLDVYDRTLYKQDDTLAPVDRPYHVLLRSSSFFDETSREKTPFWMEYQLPSHAKYEIFGNILLHNCPDLRCKLCFARSESVEDFSITDMRLVRFFQPHLSRITDAYLSQPEFLTEIENLKNYNCIGFCIVNENLQIIKTNDTFLTLNNRINNRLLSKILDLCRNILTADCNSPYPPSYEYKFDDDPIFVEIICAPGSSRSPAQCGCLVYDLSHFFKSTLSQMRERYHLTDREYEVLTFILQGLRNEEIGKKLFLSVPSIKKYVASIFDKMGISNQKQLFSKLSFL